MENIYEKEKIIKEKSWKYIRRYQLVRIQGA